MMESNNLKSNDESIVYKIESKLNLFTKLPVIPLIIIGIIALSIRLLFFEPEIPIRQDATAYFWYAIDMSILHRFPVSVHANDGWPIFLSLFFSVFNFESYLEYTILQRMVTIIISVITIIPMYYLCRRFFEPIYSIVGVSLFVFEPHIIQNSLLGLTEPFYILLGVTAFALFLNNNQKLMYGSFAIVGFATIVRAEGITLLVILCTVYFLINKKNLRNVRKILIAVSIFALIFIPMTMIKAQTSSIESSTLQNISNWSYATVADPNYSILNEDMFKVGFETLAKRFAQSMIPYFAIFMPFGLFLIFKDRTRENYFLIISLVVYSLVAVRMFSIVHDLRLILILYPIFAIFSVITIKYITKNLETGKIFLILIIGGSLILSGYYLYSEMNYEYEKEAIVFASYMVENVQVSNNFYPESGYVYGVWATSSLKFPLISSSASYSGPELLDYVKNSFNYLEKESSSIEEYIILARDQGLTHLVIDDKENRAEFFRDVYYNEEKFPYLIKEFDSRDVGFKFYKVKVFKIDYDYFDKLQK